jgi:hypothetical protein
MLRRLSWRVRPSRFPAGIARSVARGPAPRDLVFPRVPHQLAQMFLPGPVMKSSGLRSAACPLQRLRPRSAVGRDEGSLQPTRRLMRCVLQQFCQTRRIGP